MLFDVTCFYCWYFMTYWNQMLVAPVLALITNIEIVLLFLSEAKLPSCFTVI